MKTQRLGQIGVNVVERIVLNDWGCRWQALDAQNDDGVDGLIFFESGGSMTGQVMFVQVKCLSNSQNAAGDYTVPVGIEKLKRLLSLWGRVVGGAILVLVDPKTLQARWVNVRRQTTANVSYIRVPGGQMFDAAAKSKVQNLCGTLNFDLNALRVDTSAADFEHLVGREHVQSASRQLYRTLASGLSLSDQSPSVIFDRVGWHHITRRERKRLVRYQSFVLLGCIRKMLAKCTLSDLRPWGSQATRTFVSVDAMVTFPFRQTGLVRLVFERIPDQSDLRFYTIYEPRRKANLIGVREPRRL